MERSDQGVAQGDVIVQLMGGLGNQMFQYAAATVLAESRGTRAWIDDRALPALARRKDTTPRSIEVSNFDISARVLSHEELDSLGLDWRVLPPPTSWIPSRVWALVRRGALAGRGHTCDVVRERSLAHDPELFAEPNVDSTTYLVGYWQSAKYFTQYRQRFVTEFMPKTPLDEKLAQLRARMQGEQSLVVHVRRGDLVTNHKTQSFHGVLPASYYRQAIAHLADAESFEHVYVFTDDPQWCRTEFADLQSTTIVDSARYPGSPADHLYVMTAGKAFVIANSSFSWWAAWLSAAPPNQVVAPRQWFAQASDGLGPALTEWKKL